MPLEDATTEMPAATEESAVEVSVEVPVAPEQSTSDVAPAESPDLETADSTADAGAVLSDTAAELSGAMSELVTVKAERDALVGQLSSLTAEVERQKLAMASCDTECIMLREKLANYELGAALADQGLPTSMAGLVSTLYHADRASGVKVPGIREWLPAVMASSTHPAFSLGMLKGSAPRDPSVSPVVDVKNSALRPFPVPRS